MRKFTTREKELINNLIDNYSFFPSFQFGAFLSEQKIFSTRQLLELAHLFWFLEENGYVYISQTQLYPAEPEDVNIKKALNGIYDINQKRRVESLIDGCVFVTDLLLELKRNDYKYIEDEQLDATRSILNNAIAQTQEAKNQSIEAKNQTTEALKQTEEAIKQTALAQQQTQEALSQTKSAFDQLGESRKQTKWAIGTFAVSVVTLLLSFILSLVERIEESSPAAPERKTPIVDTSTTDLIKELMSDSLPIIVAKDTLPKPLYPKTIPEQTMD